MIRTKDIYTQICNSNSTAHRLTDDELMQLQAHLMTMYKDLEAICDKHGLQMSLAYGNVIGVERHGGWIPWDDDLDIMMPRKDYDILFTKYINELPGKYRAYSVHTKSGPYERFAKIIDTSTVYAEIMDNDENHSGVFIDIFPIDNFNPDRKFISVRKYIMFFMMYSATSVKLFLQKNKFYKELMYSSKEGKKNYLFRNLWGRMFSFIKPEKWYRWIDSFSKESQHTGLLHVPIGQKINFAGYDESIFFPPKKKTLADGTSVYIPNKSTEYLDIIYHNWKEIPKESDRWHHFVREFNLNNTETKN